MEEMRAIISARIEAGMNDPDPETIDITDFGDDTSGIDLANDGDRGQRVWDDLKLLLNSLVQHLDLTIQRPHGGNGDGHNLVY